MGRKSSYENGMYQQLMEIMGRLDTVEKEHKKETVKLKAEIADLKEENRLLRQENQLLRDDNARLKRIINNDSSNTSLPPSADPKGGKPANTYNGRKKTDCKAGGQKGHKGTTLSKAEIEEKITSGRYRHEVKTIGNTSGQKYVTKYVVDLAVEPVITEVRIYADENGVLCIPAEYRSDVTYGANIKALAVSLYSEGVMSNDRIASFLNAASNGELNLSEGSIYGFCKKMENVSVTSIINLEKEQLNRKVVATDATTVTVNGKLNYIRNFSTDNRVIYHAMNSKSIDALKELDFLKCYSGTLLHDHETALYHFGTEHAECNTPSHAQSIRMKKAAQQVALSSDSIYEIMSEEKANQTERISFKVQDLRGFFPKNYTQKQMTDTILKLLYENQRRLERKRNSRDER